MAFIMHNHLGPMTKAQFAALPPHLKLQNSETLVHELNLGNAPPQVAVQTLHNNTLIIANPRPKRPVNSWMAFRSYYTRIFANLQQKQASRRLADLWREDPFKAKWTIVAKAYTRVRSWARGSLDVFLELACPAIGIISAEEYLTKMNWSLVLAENGDVLTVYQTSSPVSTGFEHHIMHTSMTDIDLILWAGACRFIPMDVAEHLARNAGPLQQNLLATAPAFQRPAPPRPAPPSAPFLQTGPVAAAAMVLGFDITSLLDDGKYKWTGSMSDLYNPDAGFINIESIANDEASGEWDIANIQDPRGFDSLFEGVVEDGYSTPNVPDEEGNRRLGHL